MLSTILVYSSNSFSTCSCSAVVRSFLPNLAMLIGKVLHTRSEPLSSRRHCLGHLCFLDRYLTGTSDKMFEWQVRVTNKTRSTPRSSMVPRGHHGIGAIQRKDGHRKRVSAILDAPARTSTLVDFLVTGATRHVEARLGARATRMASL